MTRTKHLMLESFYATNAAIEKFSALKSDTVTLGEAEAILWELRLATSKLTSAVSVIRGCGEPKTGE